MIEEIKALTRRGYRVGVMQVETYRSMTPRRKLLCRPIQTLINEGTVDHLLDCDDVQVSLLLIRYPSVLQFVPDAPSSIRADKVIIIANEAPCELDGSRFRYVPAACTENAYRRYAVMPQWCPQGPLVRAALQPFLDESMLTAFDIPGVIDIDMWAVDRAGFRSDRPVIGRHSRDDWRKWPGDRKSLLAAYPDSTDFDVRFMGGASHASTVLGTAGLPSNWTVYDYDEVSVRSFLYQLDFYVHFPHPHTVEAFDRSTLEALAVGCVAILPAEFEGVFGDAAVYRAASDVQDTVRHYYSNPQLFIEKSRLAQDWVRKHFSYDTYADLVAGILKDRAGAASQT